jgi:exopolyphosphatase / guanosine-5'-triphosphate,3'-diphosphate pyrophosphatase
MRVGVIDIGSNSIKALVADGTAGSPLVEVASRTLEARISGGIGSGAGGLSPEGMERGVAAVTELAGLARQHHTEALVAVATSAVRDAANGSVFTARVEKACGVRVRILSGEEEATYIGMGLGTEPALAGVPAFDVFDLGGGSLECLRIAEGKVQFECSLRLGCVRLTERFVAHPRGPFGAAEREAVRAHVTEALLASGFPFPSPGIAVATGGTMTTARAIAAAARAVPLLDCEAVIPVAHLAALLERAAPLTAEDRARIPGLAASRADVYPAALTTFLAVAALSRVTHFRHSLRNLRWGIAAALLAGRFTAAGAS